MYLLPPPRIPCRSKRLDFFFADRVYLYYASPDMVTFLVAFFGVGISTYAREQPGAGSTHAVAPALLRSSTHPRVTNWCLSFFAVNQW